MVRRLLLATAFLLITSRANAATIDLLLTMDHFWPTAGAPNIEYTYRLFEASRNGWPDRDGSTPQTVLASGSAWVLPGVTQLDLSINVDSLDDVYLDIWGRYYIDPTVASTLGLYYALPPGAVPADIDPYVTGYGPPWIPLTDLDDGIAGRFQHAFGLSRGPIGTWEISAVPDAVTPVPEPASILLLGSGLAAVAAKKSRRRAKIID